MKTLVRVFLGLKACLICGLLLITIVSCSGLAVSPSPIADIVFVEIPAGTFEMGSNEGREQPVHTVTISKPFSMSIYEITQGQWEEVMGTAPFLEDSLLQETSPTWTRYIFVQGQEGDDYPATYVDWGDAGAFARRLNSLDSTHHYRLPTEAEWEYAARAGSTTEYSFGDEADSLGAYAWYRANARDVGENYAHRVGQKRPNGWGLYDMHGNVWEWVSDTYAPYESGPRTDPEAPVTTNMVRTVRGGSFHNGARFARSAHRNTGARWERGPYDGFRLVRTDL